jgi:hypothetical protein
VRGLVIATLGFEALLVGCGGKTIRTKDAVDVEPKIEPVLEELSAGTFHNCAIRRDKSLECWTLGELHPEDNHGQIDSWTFQ